MPQWKMVEMWIAGCNRMVGLMQGFCNDASNVIPNMFETHILWNNTEYAEANLKFVAYMMIRCILFQFVDDENLF